MRNILEKTNTVTIEYTQEKDLNYVLSAENHEANKPYILQWTKAQHLNALSNKDIMHLLIRDIKAHEPVGYLIMSGIEDPNKSIELKRIAITDKGKGYGREALHLIKKIAFHKLNAHRLWLDVRDHNHRAQNLYQSEGFIKEGLLRECVFLEDHYESIFIMSILKREYLELP